MTDQKNSSSLFNTPTAIIIAGFIVATGIYVSQHGLTLPQRSASNEPGQAAGVQAQPTISSGPIEVDIAGRPALGDDKAPVTIVEFTDYQCPFCQRAFSEVFPKIKSEYIDQGKIKYVLRDFPLPFHTNAELAADAANCAFDQGKFWEMHDKLFAGQAEWSDLSNSDAKEKFKAYAKDLGLSNDFNSCLDEELFNETIQKDLNDGTQYGVSGTPTFFINGKMLIGAQPFEAFEQMIGEELGW